MKIRYQDPWAYNALESELSAYVAREVTDRGTHGSGQLEDMQGTLDKLTEAFGRLVETLVEHKLLYLNDVAPIVASSDKLEAQS